jgi:hypothetical protein
LTRIPKYHAAVKDCTGACAVRPDTEQTDAKDGDGQVLAAKVVRRVVAGVEAFWVVAIEVAVWLGI